MRIQSNLGSTIAMAFDECVENPATYEYAKASCERTARWLERCKKEMARLNSLEDTINPHQLLFGINQGCTFEDLRVEHMKRIAELDLDGYAIGGLAVGEPTEEMYRIIEAVAATPATATPSHGRAAATCSTPSTSWTRPPWMKTASALSARSSAGRTSTTCSRRGRCWPCA